MQKESQYSLKEKREERPFIDFYRRHGISPVSQNISNLKKHLERRKALYRHLGIPPTLVKDRTVIEFGPGNGHNAIYTTSLNPSRYVLVDGNPTGLKKTKELMSEYSLGKTKHDFIECIIEDYTDDRLFDFVLCEAVIPLQNNPKEFLRKVARFVAVGGVLVITCMDSVSILSEMLRRLLGSLIVKQEVDIDTRLRMLLPFFKKHLETLEGMSRPHEDWVLDNILQPFIGDFMSIEDAINSLSCNFDVYGSSPHFFSDWRWYKDIHGHHEKYNEIAIDAYCQNIHNLIDYRFVFRPNPININKSILELCSNICKSVLSFELTREANYLVDIRANLIKLSKIIKDFAYDTSESLDDFILLLDNYLLSKKISDCGKFVSFFGRGQQYLSFIRRS